MAGLKPELIAMHISHVLTRILHFIVSTFYFLYFLILDFMSLFKVQK